MKIDQIMGMEKCLIGICYRMGKPFLVYDSEKVKEQLQERGMTEEEAENQYEEFTTSWMGDHTPGFLEELSVGQMIH